MAAARLLDRPIAQLVLAAICVLALVATAAVHPGAARAATLAPTLASPTDDSMISGPVMVNFTLPEDALTGSVSLTFMQGGSATATLKLADETTGTYNFVFFPGDPVASSAGNVTQITGTLADGTYSHVVLSYQDTSADPQAQAQALDITLDNATQTPTLDVPSGGTVNGPFDVDFTLPEAAHAGTVKLAFTGAATPIITLATTAAGAHSVSVDPADLNAAGTVTGGSTLPDGTYTVAVQYQDAVDNPAEASSVGSFAVDTVTDAPAAPTAPSAAATGAFAVGYTLPEAAQPGTVQLVFTGAPGTRTLTVGPDTAGTHSVVVDPADLAAAGSASGGTTLADGSWTVALRYEDALGNAAASSSASSAFTIDTAVRSTTPAPTTAPTTTPTDTATQAPVLGAVSATATPGWAAVTFSLPESPLAGSVALTFTGAVTRTVVLTQAAAGSGTAALDLADLLASPDLASISGGAYLPVGVYAVTLSYRDALGNPAASVTTAAVTVSAADATKRLRPAWTLVSHKKTRTVTAMLAPSAGAVRYSLIATSGKRTKSGSCRVVTKGSGQSVHCTLTVPLSSKWTVTLRAVSPAGTGLARAAETLAAPKAAKR